jgi:hypothetical protein
MFIYSLIYIVGWKSSKSWKFIFYQLKMGFKPQKVTLRYHWRVIIIIINKFFNSKNNIKILKKFIFLYFHKYFLFLYHRLIVRFVKGHLERDEKD